ncbi:MAG: transketolase C-terminal domain-containing protein [Pseudomonadota bacterium]|nr:transketolase C-terminal domain-containing protein [Pseudomonadota bacterium]
MTRSGRDLLRAALERHVAKGGMLVGESVGVHGVTEGFAAGPGLLRTPLSEGAAVGVAVGLALAGKKVIVELVDPLGLVRAADVLGELASLRARTGAAWSAPVVIRAPFAPFASLTAWPAGLRVAVAATADDLVGMLAHALDGLEPVLLLEAPSAHEGVGTGAAVPPLGTAVTRREGKAATVFALAGGVDAALAVAEGEDVEVVDLRGLAPLDRAGLGAHVRRTGRAVVIGAPEGLLVALEEAFLSLEAPLISLPADASPDRIAAAIRDTVSY